MISLDFREEIKQMASRAGIRAVTFAPDGSWGLPTGLVTMPESPAMGLFFVFWRRLMKKRKTANFIMVLMICVIMVTGIGLAFYFQKDAAPVIPEGTSGSFTDNGNGEFTCTIEIRCDTVLSNLDKLEEGKAPYVPADGMILKEVTVSFKQGETAFEILRRVCEKAEIQIEYSWNALYNSYYVEGINHLYEFDCGPESGWMYCVNNGFPNYGSSSYTVQDGDDILWIYTCAGLGSDVGAPRE